MKVLLMPSVRCNRKCEYCYLHSEKTKEIVKGFWSEYHDPGEWMLALDFFEREYGQIDSVDISGGEPFIYRDFTELLKRLVERYGKVNLTSNLDLIPDEFYDFPYKHAIFITVSYHLNDGKLNWPILETMKKMKAAGFRMSVNFVAEEKQLYLYPRLKTMIGDMFGMYTHLEPYVDYNLEKTFFGLPKDENKLSLYKSLISPGEWEAIEVAKKRGIENPKKITCNVSDEYAVIMENGDVFPCLGMAFENRGLIANVFRIIQIEGKPGAIECDIFCPCAQNYRDGFR